MSLWLIMIILHAVAALVCFVTGCMILSPTRAKRFAWAIPVFMISLVGMIVFMVSAMAAHWHELSVSEQIIFSGLVGLALYMLYRSRRAQTQLREKAIPASYVDGIGFSLISLFNGFIIVALIDLNAPFWVVIGGAILGIIVGGRAIARVKDNYTKSLVDKN